MENMCPVMKVASPISKDNDQGFILINESDFDPKIHTKFGAKKVGKKKTAKKFK